jgi:hypothetical protein
MRAEMTKLFFVIEITRAMRHALRQGIKPVIPAPTQRADMGQALTPRRFRWPPG